MPQISSISDFKAYKYKDLKVYSSTEWLTDNRKRYRQVFEQSEVRYIYADLAIINKLYDREDWTLKVTLKCYTIQKVRKEVCTLNVEKTISKNDHTVHIREGWGHKRAGSFWKKGKYIWEAYIDDERVGTKTFYIEDMSSVADMEVEQSIKATSLRFYESNYDQTTDEDDRIYYTEFDNAETRYVFIDLELSNLVKDRNRFIEVIFKIYNEARDLKGEVSRIERVSRNQESIAITAGWGANVKGSWRVGEYAVEVIYHNRLIASSSFFIGDEFMEGDNAVMIPDSLFGGGQLDIANGKAIKAYRDLNTMIGLQSVKKQVQDHTSYIKFLQLRKQRGFDEAKNIKVHSVFKGNPGTGKTSVARLLGAIYHDIGILSSGHVHEVGRVDLVGEYIGQTAPKVKEAIERAKGGVLFIDEAYSLARNNSDSKDFGREVIELLIKEMSQPNCPFMVIVAGYPEEMDTFIESNPGLSSRFRYYYDFPDYELDDLMKIAHHFADRLQVSLSDKARDEIYRIIKEEYRNRDKKFGNARMVEQLVEKAKINLGIRLMKKDVEEISDEQLSRVSYADVLAINPERSIAQRLGQIDETALDEALAKLNALIGLQKVKERIHDLVSIVRYRIERGLPIENYIKMHTVLTGNPGTGKTTVTRICSEIYKALGILSRGHMVETDRQGLIAGFVGQTATKTLDLINSAIGGVLFIDEAYGLIKKGASNDFGDEAVQVLIKQMEDRRGEFFVFAAGYPKEMDTFLKMNPGLKSRFDVFLHFEDYNVDELVAIGQSFFEQKGYKASSDAIALFRDIMTEEHDAKDQQFGNARRVRAYVEAIIHAQNVRIANEQSQLSTLYDRLIKSVDITVGQKSLAFDGTHRRKGISF